MPAGMVLSRRLAVHAVLALTLASVAAGGDPRELPILGVQPIGGALRWYLDHEAAPQ